MEIAKLVTDPLLQSKMLAMVVDLTDFPRKDEWKQVINQAGQMGAMVNPQQMGGLSQAMAQAPNQAGSPVGGQGV